MNHYPHPIIAREGWPYLGLVFVVSLIVMITAGFLWSLPLWVITLFVLQFFRDPPRVVPKGEGLILSPADGRIVVVAQTTDPYRQCPALKISVFMNVFNVHSNRSPINGVVRAVEYFPGSFVNADLDKASLENERNAVLIDTPNPSHYLTCVQVAGLIARRILCYVGEEDHLFQGQRYGFIRFGSRVDLYLPPDAMPRVAIGDKVSATETVLAQWAGSIPH